jgi:hypothetical protein
MKNIELKQPSRVFGIIVVFFGIKNLSNKIMHKAFFV